MDLKCIFVLGTPSSPCTQWLIVLAYRVGCCITICVRVRLSIATHAHALQSRGFQCTWFHATVFWCFSQTTTSLFARKITTITAHVYSYWRKVSHQHACFHVHVLLQEALANRVAELEKELACLRSSTTSGRPSEVTREETASQTDPPHWTVESGIQVDIERSSSTPKTQSCADTDCVSEEDLPFDGDSVAPAQTAAFSSAAPPTADQALVSSYFIRKMLIRWLTNNLPLVFVAFLCRKK